MFTRKQKNVALEAAFKLSNGLNVSLERLSGMEDVKIPTPIAEYLAGKRQKAKEPQTEAPTLSEAIGRYIAKRSNALSPSTIRGYRLIQQNRFKNAMPRRLNEIGNDE